MRKLTIILSILILFLGGYKSKATPPQDKGKYEYIDMFYSQDLKVVMANGKWGFIDRTGKEVIPLQYDYAWAFDKNYTQVKLDDETFYIDKTGNKLNSDSIRLFEKQEIEDEFRTFPLVSAEVAAEIAPVIKKWTDFYNIDFGKARLVNVDTTCFNCPLDSTSIYYIPWSERSRYDDNRIEVDYSPDKLRDVSLGLILDEVDGKYYHIGWDDCQSVYLTDSRKKQLNMIQWNGTASHTEAVFWKSNDVFILMSCHYLDSYYVNRFADVFDIAKQTRSSYRIMREEKDDLGGYMYKIYMKEKGIFTEEDREYEEYMKR